jgi:hypothetical protein
VKGHLQLAKARVQGYRPAKPIEVWLGRDGPYLGDFGIDDLFVSMNDPVARLDLRCLHGLPVWLIAPSEEVSPMIDPMVARLREHGIASLIIFRLWLDNEDSMVCEEMEIA